MEINEWIQKLMQAAITVQSSDVYFLPHQMAYVIKFHTAQGLINYQRWPLERAKAVINYFKYNGHMQISERRRPLMGALNWQMNHQQYFLRLSTVADFNAQESLVIRIIYSFSQMTIKYLASNQFQTLQQLSRQRGLMLFAGPTGSGKTSTIYHLARQFKADQLVMSIEDPVEINEADFLQLQVNPEAGMDYQSLLKVGLRSRPDIFIIGEIRDAQTAQVAVQAALSGHLVFSTVHAQNPLGVVERLLHLGINREYLRSCLNAVIYQRLIPTRDHNLASLFSIATNRQLFIDQITNDQLIAEWRSVLEQSVKQGHIEEKVKQRYWLG